MPYTSLATFARSVYPPTSACSFQISAQLIGLDNRCQALRTKYRHELELRKKYHNELVELKGQIRLLIATHHVALSQVKSFLFVRLEVDVSNRVCKSNSMVWKKY
jgi:hypothetical protein